MPENLGTEPAPVRLPSGPLRINPALRSVPDNSFQRTFLRNRVNSIYPSVHVVEQGVTTKMDLTVHPQMLSAQIVGDFLPNYNPSGRLTEFVCFPA